MDAKNRFEVTEKLGEGAFSSVYKAIDHHGNKAPVALKVDQSAKHHLKLPLVAYEARVLKQLQSISGVPRFIWAGTVPSKQGPKHAMAIQLLGQDLNHALQKHLTVQDAALIGLEILAILREVHNRGFLHRDLKPANIMLRGDRNQSSRFFLSDFGLAKRYLDADGNHIPDRKKSGVTGTLRFAATPTHFGSESSRRDDVESLLYVIINLTRTLPWQGTKHGDDIGAMKRDIKLSHIIPGSAPLQKALKVARRTDFAGEPEYDRIAAYLRQALESPS